MCVCNSTYCDSPPRLTTPSNSPHEELRSGLIQIYTSSKNGQRLHKSTDRFNKGSGPGPKAPPSTTHEQSTPLFPTTIYGNDLDSRKRRRTRQAHSRSRRFLDILKSTCTRFLAAGRTVILQFCFKLKTKILNLLFNHIFHSNVLRLWS